MSSYNQSQGTTYPDEGKPETVMAPPPPAGYPVKDEHDQDLRPTTEESQSRGDGFWRGCCAALCCCCALDACF
ncbi:Hypothetical predicted protein [Olea europaea subsp. europaea]|uniref:Cysteine-rich transmembrane domain-containing protein n=1 Tax=Olea europaea subsp. europaea TaxID=158383 RepID=A0A8S0VKK5_OLEEU|nr:Hypothetical predicted protein [Olea europaea subsp. europaea]